MRPIQCQPGPAFLRASIALAAGCFISAAVEAATIDFNGLSGNQNCGNGFSGCAPFTSYTQSGFTVAPLSGSWLVGDSFGHPPPFIVFTNPPSTTASIAVTDAGAPFSFSSVDLYSSVTTIPYTFTGLLNGNTVFTTSGTVPNTFGNFASVLNPHGTDAIDTLQVTLSNPPFACCSNPVGLDNIVVSASAVGDPHFTTYDGVHYDYQGIGDFLLTQSTVDDFEVQVRTRPTYDDSAVTIMSQAAATLCNHKVTFDIDRASAGGFVWLDNSSISLSVGSSRSIGNGCEFLKIHRMTTG